MKETRSAASCFKNVLCDYLSKGFNCQTRRDKGRKLSPREEQNEQMKGLYLLSLHAVLSEAGAPHN